MRNTKLQTKKEYVRTLCFFWIFTIGWFIGLIVLTINWGSISTTAIYIGYAILIFITPAGSDLFKSYRKYKLEWKEANEGPPYKWNDPVIGQEVEVIEPFSELKGNVTGLVKLGTERWQATLDNPTGALPNIGTTLKVVSRNGSILNVKSELNSA